MSRMSNPVRQFDTPHHSRRKTKVPFSSFEQGTSFVEDEALRVTLDHCLVKIKQSPELITEAISKAYIRQLFHNPSSSSVHKIKSSSIVGLLESIFSRKPTEFRQVSPMPRSCTNIHTCGSRVHQFGRRYM